MDPLTIIGLLAQFGPSLLKAIGVGADVQKVANTAASVATAITGKADIVEAADALKADPALALEFQKALIAQEQANESLYQADKQNARARDVELSKTPTGNVRANWLVGLAFIIIASCLIVVVYKPGLSEYANSTVSLILGMFIRELGNIYAFEFGTTRKSDNKDSTINSLANKL